MCCKAKKGYIKLILLYNYQAGIKQRMKNKNTRFGSLTLKQKKINDIKEILKNDSIDLDYLFKDSLKKLDGLSVIEAERQMALENLRTLTTLLQKREFLERKVSE